AAPLLPPAKPKSPIHFAPGWYKLAFQAASITGITINIWDAKFKIDGLIYRGFYYTEYKFSYSNKGIRVLIRNSLLFQLVPPMKSI
ncbi:MAG: hypothetical protein ACP5E3_14895, partial [Bacteroidales bacterium]